MVESADGGKQRAQRRFIGQIGLHQAQRVVLLPGVGQAARSQHHFSAARRRRVGHRGANAAGTAEDHQFLSFQRGIGNRHVKASFRVSFNGIYLS